MATATPTRTSVKADRKVRVIAKVRGLSDLESAPAVPWLTVNQPHPDASHTVSVAFGDQSLPSSSHKECYVVDCCYLSHQGPDIIFSREVEPLISALFDDARNVTVIASGPRATGKTYLFQGTQNAPGLAPLAMAQILSVAQDRGMFVAVSLYEIDQDHVRDLLHPQRHQVFPCKDAKGNIQLKGLSQVRVTSVPEFLKLYCGEQTSCKATPKTANQPPHRTHKGLIVHVLSRGQKLDIPVGKMNFVDFAGYEDVRRKSGGELNLVESTKINKSIHALHNVVYSLNINEAHIPYRESKLTYMLEDSLGGRSKILMITCVNPYFCQDSIYMMSLASRSCRSNDRIVSNSTKKASSSTRPVVPISHRSRISGTVSNTMKKQTTTRVFSSGKKPNSTRPVLKARKLFDEASGLQIEKASSTDIVSTVDVSVQEEQLVSKVSKEIVPLEVECSSLCAPKDETKINLTVSTHHNREASSLTVCSTQQTIISDEAWRSNDNHEEVVSRDVVVSVTEKVLPEKVDKENNNSMVNENGSPPVSARLQELSNSLKLLLHSSTPAGIELTPKHGIPHGQTSTDLLEPRTPDETMKLKDGEISSVYSPWKTFSIGSSRVKNTLVKEYLRFLNSASKEELKRLKGIGEKRATYILKLREASPERFKDLDDVKDIGLSAKQIKDMINKEVAGLFD